MDINSSSFFSLSIQNSEFLLWYYVTVSSHYWFLTFDKATDPYQMSQLWKTEDMHNFFCTWLHAMAVCSLLVGVCPGRVTAKLEECLYAFLIMTHNKHISLEHSTHMYL